MKTKKRLLSVLLSLVMVLGLVPGLVPGMSLTAYASLPAVTYLDASGTQQTCNNYALVSDTTKFDSSANAWYVANSNVTFTEWTYFKGNVQLILCDGVTLTFEKGISVDNMQTSITIYAQSTGTNMGKLLATSDVSDAIYVTAGITINGGTVTATYTGTGDICRGISANNDSDVIINGGTVNATSGGYQGILAKGNFVINGGTVNSTCSNGYGISGYNGVYINGGTVTAAGSDLAIYGEVKNAIPGTGWTDVDGTQGEASIDVDTTGRYLGDYYYKKVRFKVPESYTVTYKVAGGTWSDDSTTDKTEIVAEGSKPASVPTSMKAASGYTGGAWDTDPTSATITGATTFTYTFTEKQAATVTKAPEAKTLNYTGKAQELVTAGIATGGEMQYALGTDATTVPTTDWRTSIPTGTEAGTYYVWYKVKGDDNHNDVDPTCVEAKINPVDKTDLTSAIAAVKDYYNTIKDNDDYKDVADALKTAIENAEAVESNDNVTSDAVATVVTTINTAKSTAEAGVKEVDDTKAAQAVIDTLNALPASDKVETTDKAAIEVAREAYDALTENQKAKVSADTLKKLTDAETALATVEAAEKAEAEKKVADEAAAKAVTDKINALPSSDKVATSDKEAIEAARKAYNALTADQKKLVDAATLKKLTDAETALTAAENKKDEAPGNNYSSEWVDGLWYNADGTQTYDSKGSWKTNGFGWWYEAESGWYPVATWQKIDGKWYYFDAEGYMASNEWIGGYWLSGNGAWEYEYIGSWKTNGTDWWYEDTSGWYPVSQWQKIDGKWYYFGSDGIMLTDQYIDDYWVGSDGSWQ